MTQGLSYPPTTYPSRSQAGTTYTILASDKGQRLLFDTTGGNVVVTFPDALGGASNNFTCDVERDPVDTTSGTITVINTAATTIGAILSPNTTVPKASLRCVSDGTTAVCKGTS